MGLFDCKAKGLGPVSTAEVARLIEQIGEIVAERIEAIEGEVERQAVEIRRLKRDLETERRLRLGARSR